MPRVWNRGGHIRETGANQGISAHAKAGLAGNRPLFALSVAEDVELAVAWGIKEHVRQVLAALDTASFQRHWAHLERAVRATRLPEPAALFRTLRAWRRELLTFCRTRVTNARTEAANLTAKTIKRVGRGYRNHDNYRCRIIGYAPRPIAA